MFVLQDGAAVSAHVNKKEHPGQDALGSPDLILSTAEVITDDLRDLQLSREQQHKTWLQQLDRLSHHQLNMAFLPVGWGADCKGPMLTGWTESGGFSIKRLQEWPGIRSVGVRTFPLIAFDFDGSTAVDLACQLGMEPWAPEAASWHVHRSNDPWRLKIFFQPTPEQCAQLPIGKSGTPEFQGKTATAPKRGDAKGEALEVFFDGGRQAIVLGEHPSSGGFYYWPENLGPEALSPPPRAWWDHAIRIAEHSQARMRSGSKSSSRRSGDASRLDPCPVCGRHSGQGGSALWCGQTREGLILCMPGSTFSAEQRHGRLRINQVVNGYKLIKRTAIPEGDVLTFTRPGVQGRY